MKNWDSELTSNSIQNKSEATSGNKQIKNLLVCNFCDKGFANEVELRNHTRIDHGSERIRYRRI